MTGEQDGKIYDYSPEVRRLVPISGEYPSAEELRQKAEEEARRIAKIIQRREAGGGRAG